MESIKNKQSAIFYWALTIIYMGLIFYVSSFKGNDFPSFFNSYNTFAHIGIYFILAVLLYIALKKSGVRKNVLFLSVLIAVVYGITDELHQINTPGRGFEIVDILSDTFGAFLGSYFASFTITKKKISSIDKVF
jgi:VanZ family protein